MSIRPLVTMILLMMAWCMPAQVVTAVDSTQKKIGAQFNLTLKATVDTTSRVVFPTGRNFGALEVIRNYKVDTVAKGKTHELIKRYGLTQFDSGSYLIPSLKVTIDKKPFLTDSIRVSVQPVKVDTLKQRLYDIRDIIREGEVPGLAWWVYFLIALAVAAAGFGVWWLIQNNKVKKEIPVVQASPIEKANTLLVALEQKQLWQKGEVKAYYSELTDIARNYIEEAIHIPAMESTTAELIIGLRLAAQKKQMNISAETLENLETVLKQADLVKFAKNRPLEFEIASDRKKIENAIVTLDKAIPEEKDNEESQWENYLLEREEKLKKKARQRRLVYGVASGVFLILAAVVLFVAIKGFDEARTAVFGHPSKKLLEGEWIASEYGNPPMLIETPRVLTRMVEGDTAGAVNRQKFAFSKVGEPLDILMITTRFEDQVPVDNLLERSVEEIPQMLSQNLKAQNITVKSDPFKSRTGQSGMKTFGNMKLVHPVTGKPLVAAYEMLTFIQPGGMNQLLVIYDPQDKYAIEMVNRMFDSVELKLPLTWVK